MRRTQNQLAQGNTAAQDALQQDIEDLVDSIHGHARSLTLLAPALRWILPNGIGAP